jgi:hypothetical protein
MAQTILSDAETRDLIKDHYLESLKPNFKFNLSHLAHMIEEQVEFNAFGTQYDVERYLTGKVLYTQ